MQTSLRSHLRASDAPHQPVRLKSAITMNDYHERPPLIGGRSAPTPLDNKPTFAISGRTAPNTLMVRRRPCTGRKVAPANGGRASNHEGSSYPSSCSPYSPVHSLRISKCAGPWQAERAGCVDKKSGRHPGRMSEARPGPGTHWPLHRRARPGPRPGARHGFPRFSRRPAALLNGSRLGAASPLGRDDVGGFCALRKIVLSPPHNPPA